MSLSQNASSTEDTGFQLNQTTQERERRHPAKLYTDTVFSEHSASTPQQQQPIIKTNVTQTDRIWLRETTPPKTAETSTSQQNNWLSYSGLDSPRYSGWRESSSFSSDTDSVSSQDTVIMMTSEEIANNEQKITESSRQYEEAKNNQLMSELLNFPTSSSLDEDKSVFSTDNAAIYSTNPISAENRAMSSTVILPKSETSSQNKTVTQTDTINKSKVAGEAVAERLKRNATSSLNSKVDEDMDDGYDSSDAMGSDTSNSSSSTPSPNSASASGGLPVAKDESISPEQSSNDTDIIHNQDLGSGHHGAQKQDTGLRNNLDHLHKTVPTFRQMNASLRRDVFKTSLDRKGKIPLEDNVRSMTYGLVTLPEGTSQEKIEESESSEAESLSNRPSSPTQGVYNISSQTRAKWAGRNYQNNGQSDQISSNTDNPNETSLGKTTTSSSPVQTTISTVAQRPATAPTPKSKVIENPGDNILNTRKGSTDKSEYQNRKDEDSESDSEVPKERKTLITFNDTVEVFYEDRDRRRTGFHKLLNRLNKGTTKQQDSTDAASKPALVGILKKGDKKRTIPGRGIEIENQRNKENETRTAQSDVSYSVSINDNEPNIHSNQQISSSAKTNPPKNKNNQNTTEQVDTLPGQIPILEYNNMHAERLANYNNKSTPDQSQDTKQDQPQIKILPAYRDNNLQNKGVIAVEHSSQKIKTTTNNSSNSLKKDQMIRSKPSRQAIKRIDENVSSDENSRNVETQKSVSIETNEQTNIHTDVDNVTKNVAVKDNSKIRYMENEVHRGNIILPQRKVYTPADRSKKTSTTTVHEKNLSDAIRMIINPQSNVDETSTTDSPVTKKPTMASSEESLSSTGSSNNLSDTVQLVGAKPVSNQTAITKPTSHNPSEMYKRTAWNIVTGNKPSDSTEVVNDVQPQGEYKTGARATVEPQVEYKTGSHGTVEPQGTNRDNGILEQYNLGSMPKMVPVSKSSSLSRMPLHHEGANQTAPLDGTLQTTPVLRKTSPSQQFSSNVELGKEKVNLSEMPTHRSSGAQNLRDKITFSATPSERENVTLVQPSRERVVSYEVPPYKDRRISSEVPQPSDKQFSSGVPPARHRIISSGLLPAKDRIISTEVQPPKDKIILSDASTTREKIILSKTPSSRDQVQATQAPPARDQVRFAEPSVRERVVNPVESNYTRYKHIGKLKLESATMTLNGPTSVYYRVPSPQTERQTVTQPSDRNAFIDKSKIPKAGIDHQWSRDNKNESDNSNYISSTITRNVLQKCGLRVGGVKDFLKISDGSGPSSLSLPREASESHKSNEICDQSDHDLYIDSSQTQNVLNRLSVLRKSQTRNNPKSKPAPVTTKNFTKPSWSSDEHLSIHGPGAVVSRQETNSGYSTDSEYVANKSGFQNSITRRNYHSRQPRPASDYDYQSIRSFHTSNSAPDFQQTPRRPSDNTVHVHVPSEYPSRRESPSSEYKREATPPGTTRAKPQYASSADIFKILQQRQGNPYMNNTHIRNNTFQQ